MTKDSLPPRLAEYIKETLPWAHGHQRKAMTTFVAAIFDKQTGCQAALARTLGNQEAAVKRLSRLLHNRRLRPPALADWVCRQALSQLPRAGRVRLMIDWTSEGYQHLLVISLVIGRRAVPLFWRAYDQRVLKGRMRRYELAVVKRACKLICGPVSPRRVRLTADRGFADDDLFDLLQALGIRFVIRGTGCVKVCRRGQWVKLNRLGFVANARHRDLGRIEYCERSPRRLWVTMSRARQRGGGWGIWYLVSNRPLGARQAAAEYGFRWSCEAGFKDTKWWLGFKRARVSDIRAWSRLFALFAVALLALASLGTALLIPGDGIARRLLRRVASRRRRRCELSLMMATLSLIQQDRGLLDCLFPSVKLKLEAGLPNVS